jgi:chemotaxis protein methyltransferase CheR
MTMTSQQTEERTNEITDEDFAYLQVLVRDRSAIELEVGQEYLVDSRLRPVARQHDLADLATLVRSLRASMSPTLEADVIDAMTTNETSFFRDRHPFDDLTETIIPEIMAKKGAGEPLTIWSGASSSGQEPYTLAILLNENFPTLVQQRMFRIVATDLSPTMVKRTAEGRYSQFEVNRGLPAPFLLTYFEQEGRDWVVRSDLADMIEAKELNLLDEWSAVPRCDLVLLRNVLIYFSQETKHMILEKIRTEILRPDGYLLLGSSETTLNINDNYAIHRFERGSCYRPKA